MFGVFRGIVQKDIWFEGVKKGGLSHNARGRVQRIYGVWVNLWNNCGIWKFFWGNACESGGVWGYLSGCVVEGIGERATCLWNWRKVVYAVQER